MSFSWSHDRTRLAGGHRASIVGGTLLLAAGATLLAGCGGGSSSHSSTATQPPGTQSSGAAPTTGASSHAMSTPTVIRGSNAEFGPILADAKGMTLYIATGDTATQSGCTGACLNVWPPLILPAGQTQPVAGPGVTGLGTFMRSDGIQVTYHGKPLYTWTKDTAPGQITGEGVVDSGGTWHVATVGGASPSAATTQPPAPATTNIPASPPTTKAPSSGGASF